MWCGWFAEGKKKVGEMNMTIAFGFRGLWAGEGTGQLLSSSVFFCLLILLLSSFGSWHGGFCGIGMVWYGTVWYGRHDGGGELRMYGMVCSVHRREFNSKNRYAEVK
jgi:hypothetical protein